MAKVEKKIMVKDYNGAREIVNPAGTTNRDHIYIYLIDEVERVIDYCEVYGRFNALASAKGKESEAISYYETLIKTYNAVPDTLNFSEKFTRLLNTSFANAGKYINRQCGGEYNKIRVGMTLAQVQKCVGEFFLVGQVNRKDGVVSQYRRGNGYVVGNDFLLLKDGRVIAWDSY